MTPRADGEQGIDPGRLVFVAGLHRSGTTPLTRILGEHPEVSTFRDTGVKEDEGQHLQTVYPSARSYGGAGEFAFDARSHLTETSPLCTAETAARLLDQWAPHWDLERPLLVEKSPPNLVMTRFLSSLFPGSRIVVTVRHPVVVALSTLRWSGPFGRLERLVDHWLAAHEIFRADAAALDSVHVLRYESLVAHPAETLAGVADFLGLSTPIPSESVDARRSEGYLADWEQLQQSRMPWSRRTLKALRRREEAIASFGYALDDLTRVSDEPVVSPGGGEHD